MKKNIKKYMLLLTHMIFSLLCLSFVPKANAEEDNRKRWNNETAYIVCAAEEVIVYDQDKKTEIVKLQKDDSMIMLLEKSNSKWVCILMDGDFLAYANTSSLLKTKSGKIKGKKITVRGLSVLYSDVSLDILKSDSKSEKIAVMKARVSIIALQDFPRTYPGGTKVNTFFGEGYVYNTNGAEIMGLDIELYY